MSILLDLPLLPRKSISNGNKTPGDSIPQLGQCTFRNFIYTNKPPNKQVEDASKRQRHDGAGEDNHIMAC